MHAPLIKTIEVPCGVDEAFAVFVDEMPTWWPLNKFSASVKFGKTARALNVEPRSGGRIVEHSDDDTEHLWGTITRYEPPGYVSMDLHIGLPPETSSVVEVKFTQLDEERTHVELKQSEWERFGEFAEMMMNGYPKGWRVIFDEAYLRACEAAADRRTRDESARGHEGTLKQNAAPRSSLSFSTLGGTHTADQWLAAQEDAPSVIVAPALGVRASYYADLCESLAARGISACAVDLLGAGNSPVKAGRDQDWGYAELIDHYRAALAAAHERSPKSPLFLLGHSAGGHVSLMLAGQDVAHLRGVALVAAGTPWWRCWPGFAGLRIRVMTSAFGLIARTVGYFPGPSLGFGGREAKTFMTEWSTVGRTGRFASGDWSGEPHFARPGPPILAISVEGDDFAPAEAVDSLVGKVAHREVTRIHWSNPPKGMNHTRWARDHDFVVGEIARFIERLTS